MGGPGALVSRGRPKFRGGGGAKILGGGMNHNDAMVCMYMKQMYVQLFQLYQGHS